MMDFLARVAWLFGLVLYPAGPTPEPLSSPTWLSALGALLIALTCFVSYRFARNYFGFEPKLAAGLNVVALVALAVGASPREAPLLTAYYSAAPFVWAALAATAGALAGAHVGSSFKNKRMGAAIAVIAIGFFSFRHGSHLIASTSEQWRKVLASSPAAPRALEALKADIEDPQKGVELLTACVTESPGHCYCRTVRAETALRLDRWESALEELTHATSCESIVSRNARAKALALALGKRTDEATAALDLWTGGDDAWISYALAVIAGNKGQTAEALNFAKTAVELGAGRGAQLLLAALQILQEQLDEAALTLERLLAANPDDADALYNQALIFDRKGDFNRARQAYLKTLQVRPNSPDARHNLALLTLRHGVKPEAEHHARKFSETWPNDPRAQPLLARVGSGP